MLQTRGIDKPFAQNHIATTLAIDPRALLRSGLHAGLKTKSYGEASGMKLRISAWEIDCVRSRIRRLIG